MSHRDDFPPDVRRVLAARAGHKCSVCEKPTSGPASDSDSTLSDGIAAHITAAASGGPRFDATLSSEQRRSVENGIWACTQHGREIDADRSAFSVGVLRGLKRRREELAKRELSHAAKLQDGSAVLIDLPHAETAFKLFEIISPQPYTFATTSSTRNLLSLADSQSRILDLAAEVIMGTWNSHPNVAGILATLLSNNIESWQPTPVVISKLEDLCTNAIECDEWTRIATVEPLAFAIAGKGHPAVHRNVLERLVNQARWREEDAGRIRAYYGTVGNEIAAIFRHWNDDFRKGLLRANDAARLIDLLLSHDEILGTESGKRSLLNLLEAHAEVLRDAGETQLARTVIEFLEAFRSMRHP